MPKRKFPSDLRRNVRAYKQTRKVEEENAQTEEQRLEKEEAEKLLAETRREVRKNKPKGKTISFSWEVGELITFRNWPSGKGQYGIVLSVDEAAWRDWKGNTFQGRGVTILFNGMCQRVDSRYLKKIEII